MQEENIALPGVAMSVTVSSKGRITIPKQVRDLLEIGPGSMIDFERSQDGLTILVKVDKKARPTRLARLRGHAGKGPSTAESMTMIRGER